MSIGNNRIESEPTSKDMSWIEGQLKTIHEMIDFYYTNKPAYYYEPALIDDLFKILLKELKRKIIKEEVISSTIGCALGQSMVDQLGFRWIIYSDEYGTELALKHDETQWTTFPISSVWKRIDSKETGFVSAIFESFKDETEKNGR